MEVGAAAPGCGVARFAAAQDSAHGIDQLVVAGPLEGPVSLAYGKTGCRRL